MNQPGRSTTVGDLLLVVRASAANIQAAASHFLAGLGEMDLKLTMRALRSIRGAREGGGLVGRRLLELEVAH